MRNQKKTIWLVDNNSMVAEGMKSFLGEDKYKIRIFPTGDAVIDEIKSKPSEKPDLIITDRSTGGVQDGFAVLDAAKEAGIKAIMYSSKNVAVLAKKHGAFAFVLKDTNYARFTETVNKALKSESPDMQKDKPSKHR